MLAAHSSGEQSTTGTHPARWFVTLLVALAVCSALLRLPTLWSALPYEVQHDEVILVRLATGVVTSGDLDPKFQNWGTLPIHALALVLRAASEFGLELEPIGPGSYVLARGISLVLMSIAMLAVAASAARVFGSRVGLLAALLLAVSPLCTELARRALVEPWMAAGFALSGWASVRAWQRGCDARGLALAGVFAGLAASAKMTGVFAFSQPVLAWALARPRSARSLGAAAAGAFGMWLLCSPFAWLDPHTFVGGLTAEAQHYSSDHALFPRFGATSHLEYLLLLDEAVGSPAMVAALIGLVLGLRDRPGALVVCVGGAAAHFAFVGLFRFYYPRNLLVGLGALAPLAALGTLSLADLLARGARSRGVWAAGAALVLLLPPGGSSVAVWRRMSLPETRGLAARWMASNLPPNARVVVESMAPAPLDRADVEVLRVGAVVQDLDLALGGGTQFVVLSSTVRDLVLRAGAQAPGLAARYQHLYARGRILETFAPAPGRTHGPTIEILELESPGAEVAR